MERWKAVLGTDGRILVSDEGRIKSLLRDGRILKATQDSKGYLRLRITLDRKKIAYKVHRLVANAFLSNPERKPQVNHINGDKTDNRAVNLEWVTNQENATHAVRNGLWTGVFEAANRANRAKRKAVIATNGEHTLRFNSVVEAQDAFNSRHISDALKGKRQHVRGWSFRYAEGGDACAND